MPPDGPTDANFGDITDEGLQQWFNNEVDGSDGFARLLEEGERATETYQLGESPFDGMDPDLVEGFKTLQNNADIAGKFGPKVRGSMDRTDWSAEFGSLSRGQKIKFLEGWNRQHPAVFAASSDGQTAPGGWLTFRGKPAKWLVAVPVVILLVVGASILADGFTSSDDPAANGAETVATDTAQSSPAADTATDAETEAEPTPAAEPEPTPEPDPEPTPAAEPAPEPEPEPAVSPNAGTYEVSARVTGACGSYDVFLRMILFLNGEMTVDQLLTAGGNPFQSALGRWDSRVAVATFADTTFFEAWFFLFNLGDLLSIYNVYGPSSSLITPDAAVDLATYEEVASAEQLDQVSQGTDTCPSELIIDEVTHTPFP
ncbi:MAG: hypothetical protein M3132_14125 [Actinomycetia bacterium]|nr:hypothetical protein [Actinomycetes bacterium]